MLEKKDSNYAYFITLTYRPEEQTYVEIVDQKTGELIPQSTLVPKDMTLFIKAYRQTKGKHDFGKVRFFGCGEYGDINGAAHLHLIIFQEKPITDLKFHKMTSDHNFLYTSETLEKIWKKGYVIIGEVTLESAGYVRRYCTKKQTGAGKKYYEELGIEPEFVRMSRKPGIGMKWFKDHYKEIYSRDEIILQGKSLKPAKAFDEAFWELEPDSLQLIKDQRRNAAIANRQNKLSRTTLTSEEYTKVEALNKDERLKYLRREL